MKSRSNSSIHSASKNRKWPFRYKTLLLYLQFTGLFTQFTKNVSDESVLIFLCYLSFDLNKTCFLQLTQSVKLIRHR